ncbi:MAG: DUF29 family protein [Pseudanabaenaceae cyanobacterium bins.39]|nr:DUF29 family protein [Pseudanabaenaceae cyanobacterium bins.39]
MTQTIDQKITLYDRDLNLWIEHILKRCYVKSEYDYAGWVVTIVRTHNDIQDILEQSSSLKGYINVSSMG